MIANTLINIRQGSLVGTESATSTVKHASGMDSGCPGNGPLYRFTLFSQEKMIEPLKSARGSSDIEFVTDDTE